MLHRHKMRLFSILLLYMGLTFKLIIAQLDPGESCLPIDPDRQCKNDSNSECILDQLGDFFCTCDSGYEYDSNACWKIPKNPKDPCKPSLDQCKDIPNTECIMSICGCKDGFSHDDCNISICDCEEGFSLDDINLRCIPTPTLPGDICVQNSVPCNTNEVTECGEVRPVIGESVCECIDDKVTDIVNQKCWTKPEAPGDTCNLELTPCGNVLNTTCTSTNGDNYTCTCIEDLVTNPDEGLCLIKPSLPGHNCYPNFATCLTVEKDVTDCECDLDGKNCFCKCAGDFETDIKENICLTWPTLPGDSCHPSLNPCKEIENTNCTTDSIDYYCKCNPDEYFTDHVGKRCVSLPKKPGDECHPSQASCEDVLQTQCSEDVDVGNYSCTCNEGYITDTTRGRCLLPPQKPGDLCEPDIAPCNAIPRTNCEHSEDKNDYICMCTPPYGFYPINSTCLSIPYLPGDDCEPDLLPCKNVTDTFCRAKPGGGYYCECTNDLVNDPDNPRCLAQPTSPMEFCHPAVAPCIQVNNSHCAKAASNDYLCHCDANTVHDPTGRRCIKIPQKLGDACNIQFAPCNYIPNSVCHPIDGNYFCICAYPFEHYHPNNTCLALPIYPGDDCDPFYLSCTNVPNTTCSEKPDGGFMCKCNDDLINDPENPTCLERPKKPLDTCHPIVAPCNNIPNTECKSMNANGYKCYCNNAHYHDAQGQRCIPFPEKPGDACEPNIANCKHITNTSCIPSDTTGLRSCQCDGDIITDPEHGICFPLPTNPGQTCHPTYGNCFQVLNTTCKEENGKYLCICNGDFYTDIENQICIPVATLPGETCVPGGDLCKDVPNTDCLSLPDGSFTCQCVPLYFQSFNKSCINYPIQPSGECREDVHCQLVNGSSCVGTMPYKNGLCDCTPDDWDISLDGSKCLHKAEQLEDFCETLVQCKNLENSVCSDGKCICSSITFPSLTPNKCLFSVNGIGLPCSEDLQCQRGIGVYSFCSSELACTCQPGFKPSDDKTECIPIPSEELCTEDKQCWDKLGENSFCHDNECHCNPNYGLIEDVCMKTCNTTLDCLELGADGICEEDICKCQETSIEYEGMCFNKLKLGSSCKDDFECNLSISGEAVCNAVERFCVCRADHVPNFVGTACVSGAISLIRINNLYVQSITAVLIFYLKFSE